MHLRTQPYLTQRERWPRTGRHILAQYDDEAVVVYQAYRPSIGRFAAEHGFFGGDFSFSRMSWIKPNFLWMMFRCGWAAKENQETVLAVTITRAGFDAILDAAVPSTYVREAYGSEDEWKRAVGASSVRLQWDPDHSPSGEKTERRAIQLGLRDAYLRRYATEWTVRIEDITGFVREQHRHAAARDYDRLVTPREDVYPVDASTADRLGMGGEAT
uniref:DUF4291 domain-containing protein n=1 Tax=uncultured Armatimonadetes bacterium TaxID=157466 RepID=A0A6J4HEQ3_9BACT|nr:hypothetical protein AVDCRST_MAG63-512 [uncultured Armatimonadetes bacterium]